MDRHVSQVLASPPQRWILEVDERLPPSARARHHVPVLPTRPQDYMRRYRGTSLIRDGTLSQEHHKALGIVPLKGPTEEQFFVIKAFCGRCLRASSRSCAAMVAKGVRGGFASPQLSLRICIESNKEEQKKTFVRHGSEGREGRVCVARLKPRGPW